MLETNGALASMLSLIYVVGGLSGPAHPYTNIYLGPPPPPPVHPLHWLGDSLDLYMGAGG